MVAGVVGTNRGGHTVLYNVYFIGSIDSQSQNGSA
jgi:hypothetical protein